MVLEPKYKQQATAEQLIRKSIRYCDIEDGTTKECTVGEEFGA